RLLLSIFPLRKFLAHTIKGTRPTGAGIRLCAPHECALASCIPRPFGRSRSPHVVGAPDGAVPIFAGRSPVLAKEDRAIEVDDVALLADDEGRRHGQAWSHHVA